MSCTPQTPKVVMQYTTILSYILCRLTQTSTGAGRAETGNILCQITHRHRVDIHAVHRYVGQGDDIVC